MKKLFVYLSFFWMVWVMGISIVAVTNRFGDLGMFVYVIVSSVAVCFLFVTAKDS
jgi:hypothetical protein